jgi:hypothetical protein
MKVTGGRPFPASLGTWFIGFALISALLILPGAKESKAPLLYLFIFGGLFVGIPAILGIGTVYEHLRERNHSRDAKLR